MSADERARASRPHRFGAGKVTVGDDHMRAAACEVDGDLASDAAAAADDDSHGAAELALGRLPPQLGFLEGPILDAERFRSRQRHVVVNPARIGRGFFLQRRGARHHMNRVEEELRRDARLALVLAEAEHAEPGNDDHGGIRVAQRRRIRLRKRLVVRHVLLPVPLETLVEVRIHRHEHRTDAGAEEVIRAARAGTAQIGGPCRAGECPRLLRVVPVSDDAAGG